MIYTACKYAPEELFAGFSAECGRLDPNPQSFSCADGCAHPNLCGFAKAVIEQAKAQNIKEIVFTDCCDAMRRSFDVLKSEGVPFIYFLPLPHKTGEAEISFFASRLMALRDDYARYSGLTFSWERAMEACLENRAPDEEKSAHVSVSGAHGGQLLMRQVREALPGIKVRDRTCSSDRFYNNASLEDLPKSEDGFFSWYARALLTGLTPCMRMFDVKARGGAYGGDGLRGIIYHTMKFCDYYSFEYSELRSRADIPVLKIETDATPQSSGQIRTRIEAFGEALGLRPMDRKAPEGGDALYVAGLDSGSASTEAVIMDKNKNILGYAVTETGMSASKSAGEALGTALCRAGIARKTLSGIVATGYGRGFIDMDKQTVTEITCHARGAHYLFPGVRTVIDIGGQDSKIIRIDGEGNVESFVMNDKCAAGTGRFLEMQARALGLSMEEMSRLGLSWENEVQISNMCTVFAESEVVGLVARDTPVSDIIHGLNESVAAKTQSLLSRAKGEPGFAMTGGVSKNTGVVRCLEGRLGQRIAVSEHSQLCGAIGAALIGLSVFEKPTV